MIGFSHVPRQDETIVEFLLRRETVGDTEANNAAFGAPEGWISGSASTRLSMALHSASCGKSSNTVTSLSFLHVRMQRLESPSALFSVRAGLISLPQISLKRNVAMSSLILRAVTLFAVLLSIAANVQMLLAEDSQGLTIEDLRTQRGNWPSVSGASS